MNWLAHFVLSPDDFRWLTREKDKKLNSEDAKMRRPEKKIWKAGKQEKHCLLPGFLLSKFIPALVFAPSLLIPFP